MLRKIITIDEEKCIGCELCVNACHEGAIGMVNGKAKLLRDDYCDGLGDCLPACPTDAITFIEREAAPYDEAAVMAHLAALGRPAEAFKEAAEAAEAERERRNEVKPFSGCPGALSRFLAEEDAAKAGLQESFGAMGVDAMMKAEAAVEAQEALTTACDETARPSQIASWPIEIKLAPVKAPYFDADLLVAADCTAFAYGDFHKDFMRGRTTIIGCPKLDGVDYAEKLSAILEANDVRSVTVARMEVPCCGGLENAVRRAIAISGKDIPLEVATISVRGDLLQVTD